MTTANVGYDIAAFADAVTVGLGLEATPWRRAWFVEWARWEGTGAGFNPLATTMQGGEDPTDPKWNSVGVRNYASFEAGVDATVRTLALGYYEAIRATLRAERVVDRAAVVVALRTWGTMGFAEKVAGGWEPNVVRGGGPVVRSEEARRLAELEQALARLNSATLARFARLEAAFDQLVDGIIAAAVAVGEAADPHKVPEVGADGNGNG